MIELMAGRAQSWWRDEFSTWTPVARLYGLGLGILLLSFLASACQVPSRIINPMMSVAAALLMAGFVREAYFKLAKWVRHTWVKWLLVPIGTMVVALSLGGAAHVIGQATAQDPTYFPLAISFLAPLAIIPLMALAGAVLLGLLAIYMTLMALAGDALSRRDGDGEAGWVRVGRLMGTFCAVLALSTMIDSSSPLGRLTESAAGWAAVVLDMHVDTECGFGQDDRVKRINDSLVLRMFQSNGSDKQFIREACLLGPQL